MDLSLPPELLVDEDVVSVPADVLGIPQIEKATAQELRIPQPGERVIFDITEETEIGGAVLPKGTRLWINILQTKRALWDIERGWYFLVRTALNADSHLWITPSSDSPIPWITLLNVEVPAAN